MILKKNLIKKFNFIILLSLLFLTMLQFVFSSNLEFIRFNLDENSIESNKLSYSFNFDSKIEENLIFSVDLFYNGDLIEEEICYQDLEYNPNNIFRTIICPIKKEYNNGELKVIANIKKNSQIIETIEKKFYLYQNTYSQIKFENFDDKTKVIIEVNGDKENFVLKHEIPKEAIPLLNPKNKDSIIISYSQDYIILEEDPIIAWNIKKSPEKIEYVIDANVEEETQKDFKISINESKDFSYLKYIILILIFVILFMIFYPIFKKKK